MLVANEDKKKTQRKQEKSLKLHENHLQRKCHLRICEINNRKTVRHENVHKQIIPYAHTVRCKKAAASAHGLNNSCGYTHSSFHRELLRQSVLHKSLSLHCSRLGTELLLTQTDWTLRSIASSKETWLWFSCLQVKKWGDFMSQMNLLGG